MTPVTPRRGVDGHAVADDCRAGTAVDFFGEGTGSDRERGGNGRKLRRRRPPLPRNTATVEAGFAIHYTARLRSALIGTRAQAACATATALATARVTP